MAIAERRLAAEFNRPGHAIVDHRTFVICSDGDLQEGIASEAASLAGHLRLGKLTMLYDDNHVQLDGPTAMAFSEDVPARFDAYGWHTARVDDGNDIEAIVGRDRDRARRSDRPSLIAVRTHIGYGSPNKQDSQKAHGSPLGADEVRLTKEAYGWDPDRTFYVPDEAAALFSRAIPRGEQLADDWEARLARYRDELPGRGRRARAPARRRPPPGRDERARRPTRSARTSRPARRARPRSRPWPSRCRSCSAARPTCPSRT